MVECYLEATLTKCVSEENPFYGRLTRKLVIRDEFEMEKDERDDIAPSGVQIKGIIGGVYLELKISKHYLNTDDEGFYYATFSDGDLLYRVDVYFDEKGIDKDSTYVKTQLAEDYIEANDVVKDKVNGKESLFINELIS